MKDPEKVFAALATSRFRQQFHLGDKECEYLKTKGMPIVLDHAREFVSKRLAPSTPINDGKQTPWRGHPVFLAQHATATCCRGCLAKWHDIERGRVLTAEEQEYVVATIARWLSVEATR